MDVVYTILIGAGVVIVLLALFIQGKSGRDNDSAAILTHRTTDKVEMEKSLQRLGKQIKQEQDLVAGELQRTRSELLLELSQLRKRVDQIESDWNAEQTQVETGDSHTNENSLKRAEPIGIDMLALRERYRRAFELDKEGLSPDEIAKRLGAGRGEIDLIFSLATKHERGHADA